jgi:Ran GTPase-activating protein (RanGAP) involved in mRNA processing and transport
VFTNIAMSNADVDILCEIIEANDTVQVVSLQQNLITANGGKRLAMALKKNTSITELRLDHNSLKDEGVIALAEAVYHHRNLSVIGLAGNNIGNT